MQKITPFLWLNDNAEDAMNFYTSVFKNSRIVNITRNPDVPPGMDAPVLVGTLEIEGLQIYLLNGGPTYSLTEAFSLFVRCETQQETDELWTKLVENGGQESMCGWLKDKFGLSWQIVPAGFLELIGGPDREGAARAMQAMMKMRKLDLAVLQKAYAGN